MAMAMKRFTMRLAMSLGIKGVATYANSQPDWKKLCFPINRFGASDLGASTYVFAADVC